ncbi:protein of unknown function (plasmid) [Cupriavidus taiwanensis]|uniref:Uncharacterized protein n=1 Tax=Cupriavidus taiwanensis TaxID=164546 RepID=A0A9Q7XTF3_9BURK|nr:protein of unknown function [Cupriavidus taiwanensis]
MKNKGKQSLMSYIRHSRNGAGSPYNKFTLFASTTVGTPNDFSQKRALS